jgi:predicted DNA-binding transcriptional regulator YafY
VRLERLAKLLETVQAARSFRAQELADRLQVSRRTVFRDIQALARVGVPIAYDRAMSTFRLTRSRTPSMRPLTTKEREAVARLLDDRRVAALHRRAVRALRKLIGNTTLADLATGRNPHGGL